jgi:hypothetical protein
MDEIAGIGVIPAYQVFGLISGTTYYLGVSAYNEARLTGPQATVMFPSASQTSPSPGFADD